MGPFEAENKGKCPAGRAAEPDARLHEQVKARVVPSRGSGVSMRRWCQFLVLGAAGVVAAGCPKDKHDYKAAQQAVDMKDYDAAVEYYLKANKADPRNVNYKIGLDQSRFEAGALHVQKGLKLRDKGDLQGAVSEFQRAQVMDPSSTAADQELRRTGQMLGERGRPNRAREQRWRETGHRGLPPNRRE